MLDKKKNLMSSIYASLIKSSAIPADDKAFGIWLEQQDALSLLEANLYQDEFVLYASLAHTFMHAVLVPESSVNPPNSQDLMGWNCGADETWGIWHDFEDPPSIGLSPPLDHHTGSATIGKGEQLVYVRYFEGRIGDRHYIELLQKLVHVLDVHFLPERSAYCRLDKHGDIEEVIRIIETPEEKDMSSGTIVTIKREDLDEYMALTDSAAVLMFDFTRTSPGSFSGWPHRESDEDLTTSEEFSYRLVFISGYASYLRGYQLVRPRISREAVARRYRFDDRGEEKQYATFIVDDWRHGVVAEVSCGPGHTANYFNAGGNDLPFELSPTFFRPEVLTKYKADSEKYRVEDRSITCRGAWHLKTYDINEEGQVHTYLRYLRNLPYEEQLYWKAHNEKPRGPISKRAFETDFEGKWSLEYDPLRSIKNLLDELRRERVPWWALRSENLPYQVQYPATTSPDEWANEILKLDQLVVEGFEEKWLRNKAKELGRTPQQQFRSLKLIEECLMALDFEEEHAQKIISPLHEIHNLRSKLKGHASGNTFISIKRSVLTEHKTFRKHFHVLCKTCDESLQVIAEAFRSNRFTGSSSTHSSG